MLELRHALHTRIIILYNIIFIYSEGESWQTPRANLDDPGKEQPPPRQEYENDHFKQKKKKKEFQCTNMNIYLIVDFNYAFLFLLVHVQNIQKRDVRMHIIPLKPCLRIN